MAIEALASVGPDDEGWLPAAPVARVGGKRRPDFIARRMRCPAVSIQTHFGSTRGSGGCRKQGKKHEAASHGEPNPVVPVGPAVRVTGLGIGKLNLPFA